MWRLEPTNSAIAVRDFFVEKSIKRILIRGIGYGRNAQVFIHNGIDVTGIEIAKKNYSTPITVYHGSVAEMSFDKNQYDGIYCHALVHLLDGGHREN